MDTHSNHNEGFLILKEFVCQAIPNPSVLAPLSLKAEIDWPGVNPQDLMDELKHALPEEHRDLVSLFVEPARRNPDVVGAMIQGGATVLAALITAVLTRAVLAQFSRTKGATVVITVPSGATHELPVDASLDQIDQIASAVEKAQNVRIRMKIGK